MFAVRSCCAVAAFLSVAVSLDRPAASSVTVSPDRPAAPSVTASSDRPAAPSVTVSPDRPAASSVTASSDRPAAPSVAASSDRPVVPTVCCTGTGVVCPTIGNRTFHTVVAFGGTPCDNGTAAAAEAVYKCCQPDHRYDPAGRTCRRPADPDATAAAFRRTVFSLHRFRSSTAAGFAHKPPNCEAGTVLADVPVYETDGTPDPAFDYCLDLKWTPDGSGESPAEQLLARACRPRDRYCHDRSTCVIKCCKIGKMLVDGVCKRHNAAMVMPPVYELGDGGGARIRSDQREAVLYYEKLKCYNRDQLVADEFELLADGALYRPNVDVRVSAGNYCLEYAVSGNGTAALLEAYLCAPDNFNSTDPYEEVGSWKYILIMTGIVPSIVCLILTLVVYAMLSSLHNVYGYYVMCYVACLLASYVCLLVAQWMVDIIHPVLCKLIGYATLFSFLTTFCWLNVISFDIYWMLRYNNSMRKNSSISVRTIMYNIYCWGFSSIWTSITFYLQHSQINAFKEPQSMIGTSSHCWFLSYKYGTLLYFILPISLMLIVNLILFALTAIRCSKIKSELNKFKRLDKKLKEFEVEKEKFVMSIKLFLVMGIPWVFELLPTFSTNYEFIWSIIEEINALQGVLIFIIFVAKRKVTSNLRKKFTNTMDHSESTKVNTISGSSQSGSARRSYNDF